MLSLNMGGNFIINIKPKDIELGIKQLLLYSKKLEYDELSELQKGVKNQNKTSIGLDTVFYEVPSKEEEKFLVENGYINGFFFGATGGRRPAAYAHTQTNTIQHFAAPDETVSGFELINTNKHEIMHFCEDLQPYKKAQEIIKSKMTKEMKQRYLDRWGVCDDTEILDEITNEALIGNIPEFSELKKLGEECIKLLKEKNRKKTQTQGNV